MVKTLTGMLTKAAAGAVFIAVLCAAVSCLLFALAPEGSASADERRYSDGTFMGAGSFVTETETVNYARKSVTTKRIASSFPAYYNTASGVTDNCAGVAGAILMGYYDRYHADLIPGTATGTGRLVYTYYPQSQISSYIQAVINDFYSRMNVGQDGGGTTREDYKNGLSSYVQSKGLSITFGSVMTGEELDLSKLDATIDGKDPVSVFMTGFAITTSLADNGSSAAYTMNVYASSAHIMIVYGYEKVEYFDAADRLIDEKINLIVSTGLEDVVGYVTLGVGHLDAAEYAAM